VEDEREGLGHMLIVGVRAIWFAAFALVSLVLLVATLRHPALRA
jgi:uncharacterized membrane protein YqjE